MQWVLLGAVAAGLCVIEFRLLRDRARLSAVREAVERGGIVYRAPISAQWSRGWWGRGYARGMQLVVREHSFQLSYPFPGGSLLSTEWYCRAADAVMKRGQGRFLPPRVKRECIVLSIPSIDNRELAQEILLSSWRRELRAAWDALSACGVRAVGDAPERGV